jgi:hypothetical protein
MLQPAWYLPDTDWFAHLHNALHTDDGQTVIADLQRMLSDEVLFGPAQTVTATHVMLLAVEHLGDAMTHAAAVHDLPEVARLLCGLNLAAAHLTQLLERAARHVDHRAFPGLTTTPDRTVHALADDLGRASASSEMLAGCLKEAHRILRHRSA